MPARRHPGSSPIRLLSIGCSVLIGGCLALAGCGSDEPTTVYGAAQIRECMEGHGASLKSTHPPPGGGASYAGQFGSARVGVYIPTTDSGLELAQNELAKDGDLEVLRMADDQVLVVWYGEPSEIVRGEAEGCVEPFNA